MTQDRPSRKKRPSGPQSAGAALDRASADLLRRIPPQNLEAEQAVLGGIFLKTAVFHEVLDVLAEDDFYSPAHRAIYAACRSLFEKSAPIDLVTVAEELRSQDKLETVGGPAYLADLAASPVSASNALYHAKIVKDKAVARKLIEASGQIIASCFESGGDVDSLLDESEQAIFRISESRTKNTYVGSKELVDRVFRQLEELYAKKELVTGVPTGYVKLDEITAGLQPSDLIIIAGRPSMGKTAFALNLVLRAASHFDVPSAIFSLEMSMDQLMMRMLCIRAKVDLGSLRRGFINDADWQRLFDAAQDLSSAPLFIDDTPALSTLDLRARCRRLKAEKKLGLVVVDYLQLMRASRFIDSREQEISDISRSLKALAKEIHVPVVALSQLNRKVEERTDRRPKLSDLRECVTGDTLAVLADGSRARVASLVGSRPTVLCLDREGKMSQAECDRVWSTGARPVFLVRTRDGHEIRATSGHRFLSGAGWKKVEDLAPGDRLARARHLPEPPAPAMWPEARVALLAHLLGDGSYLKGKAVKYTSATREHLDLVAEAARSEFGATVREYDYRLGWTQLTLTGGGNRWHPPALQRWLAELGIYDQRSPEKRVPAALFCLSNVQVALFLRHLWATDGCIHCRKVGSRGPRCTIYYSTTSRGLADDLAALLLRLGILARIGSTRKKGYRPSFHVQVYGTEQQARFLDRVGAFGAKVPDAEKAREHLGAAAPNPNVDTLPRELWTRAKALMREKGISQRRMAVLRGTSYGGTSHYRFAPSRKVLLQYADLLDDVLLRQAAQSDIFWDEIKGVEPAGTEEVYDLTVPGPANWLADGLVSHNSGAIEQDADVIMFLYRDAVYNKQEDNPKANIAEVIVGKQRNGPIGEVELVFLKESTSFEDMEHSPAPSEYTGS